MPENIGGGKRPVAWHRLMPKIWIPEISNVVIDAESFFIFEVKKHAFLGVVVTAIDESASTKPLHILNTISNNESHPIMVLPLFLKKVDFFQSYP